jgi:putative transcriptional regulator
LNLFFIGLWQGNFLPRAKTNNCLAEKLNKNRTTVSKWCTNQMQPTIETLFEIAEALDVDVRELLVSTK